MTRVFQEPSEEEEIAMFSSSRPPLFRGIGFQKEITANSCSDFISELGGIDIAIINGHEPYWDEDYARKEFNNLVESVKSENEIFAIAHPGGGDRFLDDIKEEFPLIKNELVRSYSWTGGSGPELANLLEQTVKSEHINSYEENLKKLGDYIKSID